MKEEKNTTNLTDIFMGLTGIERNDTIKTG